MVARLALPPAKDFVPSTVAPELNVTVPVGVIVADETAAVNVTFCPKVDGLSEETTVVNVVAIFTIWASAGLDVVVSKYSILSKMQEVSSTASLGICRVWKCAKVVVSAHAHDMTLDPFRLLLIFPRWMDKPTAARCH